GEPDLGLPVGRLRFGPSGPCERTTTALTVTSRATRRAVNHARVGLREEQTASAARTAPDHTVHQYELIEQKPALRLALHRGVDLDAERAGPRVPIQSRAAIGTECGDG